MIKIAPFEGIRYNVRDASRLICPPYDIISRRDKRKLLALDKNNFVSVELPSETYSFYGKSRLYNLAKYKFLSMLKNGTLTRDKKSFYLYEQRFKYGGKTFTRLGLLAAVRLLENPSVKTARHNILPHEKILKKPASERKFFLKKLRAQTSAVFFISNSPAAARLLLEAKKYSTLIWRAKTKDAVSHTLRRIDGNSREASRLINFFNKKNKKLLIADGHHRYNVAWQYSRLNKKKANLKRKSDLPSDYVLGYISPPSVGKKNTLLVLPTHRITEIPEDITRRIEKNFRQVSRNDYLKYLASGGYKSGRLPQPIVARFNKKNLYLIPRKIYSSAGRKKNGKAVLYLENLAPRIASLTILKGIPPEKISYTHSDEEAIKKADGERKLALIFPEPALKSVFEISAAGGVMPQKSTYFYPKVYAGIAVYPLF